MRLAFVEFTSVVDREIAKVSAFVISKAVRRLNKKFTAVTCHYGVIDWLQPDWVFCADTMEISLKKDQAALCAQSLSVRPKSLANVSATRNCSDCGASANCFSNINKCATELCK